MRICVANHVTLLIFSTITGCYGKQVPVFYVTIAAGDSIKYQLLVYKSFVFIKSRKVYQYNMPIYDVISCHLMQKAGLTNLPFRIVY